jgi:hypothetical protein
MMVFLIAGILYLVGVGIVLAIKPTLMFTPDGNWKEFRIGGVDGIGTPFPFWMFCITWALVSYGIVLLMVGSDSAFGQMGQGQPQGRRNNWRAPMLESTRDLEPEGIELPPGYYMLNKRGSKNGVPRYIFIGEEPPSGE